MQLTWMDTRPNAVSLEEARSHLRVDSTAEDTYISGLVSAGTEYIEDITGRALVSGTLRINRSDLPSEIPLAGTPVQSLVSVVLTDDTGATHTLDAGSYLLDTTKVPHRLIRSSTATIPSVTLSRANPVTITVVAGYGAASAVPETLKSALKLFVSNFFENREPVVVGSTATELPLALKSLLSPYTIRIEEAPTRYQEDCWRRDRWY